MISVEEARARILASLRPTATETVSVSQAWGRVLAAPVEARLTQPPGDVSAMDGYAVRAADRGPWTVIGSAPAGHPFAGAVGPDQAVRLFTGSLIPAGADAVALQEDADRDGPALRLHEAPVAGRHVRPGGGDFRCGEMLVAAGCRLGARAVGLIAAANHPWVSVHARPRIAILATGDEISLPGDPIGPGGIVSSNAHALAALIRSAGGDPIVLPIARDSVDAIAAVADRLGAIDLLVTTGGASVGEHDLIQPGLGERGFRLDFWKIAMRPGKPLLYGRLGTTPVLGLPGNPVSAFVCGVLFLVPALARLSGLPGVAPRTTIARLAAGVRANDHREDHLRATLAQGPDGELLARPFERQDSSLLRLLAGSDGLVVRPPHAEAALAGDPVRVIRLDDGLL
ncbi:MAG: molybdopterin molybdotransferase MoeA [Acetobacteraceae bacterium]|nr:molybdopterin molybdotransferase MoeA [Acetobacteraceae bacterium]